LNKTIIKLFGLFIWQCKYFSLRNQTEQINNIGNLKIKFTHIAFARNFTFMNEKFLLGME